MSTTFNIDPQRAALLLVDIQPDFMPGGALEVENGDAILEPLERLLDAGFFRHYVATQDWHPPGHVSFASSHGDAKPFDTVAVHGHEQVLWPDHCLQGSRGAALHPELPWKIVAAVVRKGMERDSDSYSGFRNNWNSAGERPATGLAGYLRERGIETVFCCGLARDVCVKWTAEDAVAAGFEAYMIWDLTRPVDADSDSRVRDELGSAGVHIIDSGQLIGG